MKRTGLKYSIFTPVSPISLHELVELAELAELAEQTPFSKSAVRYPEDSMTLVKSGSMMEVDWNATDFLSPLYVELQRQDLGQLIIITGYLNICDDGFYSFRVRDDLPLDHVRAFTPSHSKTTNLYRVYVDYVLVYDSWSVHPRPISPLVQHARPINFVGCGYRFLRIEFFAMKTYFHGFHLEWLKPSASTFHPIPTSRMVLPDFSPFAYPITVNTLRRGAAFSLTPVIDPSVISLATPHSFTADLPEGITLDANTGVLSGFLPQNSWTLSIKVTLTITQYKPAVFTTSLFFHIFSCLFTPLPSPIAKDLPDLLEYHSGDLVVSELSVNTLDELYLEPTSFPLTTFIFSVEPSLPSGLQLNPTTGVIDGTPFVPLNRTVFTVTLSTPGTSWTCTLALEVKRIMQVTSFYGKITRGLPFFFFTEDSASPTNEWYEVIANERGQFVLEVTKTIFWIRIPEGT